MKELSLNILDIAQNSIAAGAKSIIISIDEDSEGVMVITIKDDGCGMSKETLLHVTDPFYTTRTTRKLGMGIPLLKLAAEQTGGFLKIESISENENPDSHGTAISAAYNTKHIDFTPLGDIVSTVCTLIQGHPEIDYSFSHTSPGKRVSLETRELKKILGEDISLAEPEVLNWISDYLKEQYRQNNN